MLDDLRKPHPTRYFADAGASATLGWCCFALVLSAVPLPLRALAFVIACFSLYRALAFIHELFHQQTLKRFRIFWHAVAGVPLLLPLLLYMPVHQVHHNARTYGTEADGEYEHFGGREHTMVVKLLALNLLIPFALLVRFGLLTPLSALFPVIRHKVIPAFLHLSLRMPYTAPEISKRFRHESALVEVACMVFAWSLVGSAVIWSVQILLAWSGLLIVIATLNTIRAACATHLYQESDTGRDSFAQVEDSTNIDGGRFLTGLLCPAGLEYHALHHLVPYLPYHSLPQAHARLLAHVPEDAPYRQSTVSTLAQGWQRVVRPDSAASKPASALAGPIPGESVSAARQPVLPPSAAPARKEPVDAA